MIHLPETSCCFAPGKYRYGKIHIRSVSTADWSGCMGKGGYNGGGTVIGQYSRWSDWREFPEPEILPAPLNPSSRKKRKKKNNKAADQPVHPAKPIQQPKFTQEQLLKIMGLFDCRQTSVERGTMLKRLVAETILLPTGQPNLQNHTVQSMLLKHNES